MKRSINAIKYCRYTISGHLGRCFCVPFVITLACSYYLSVEKGVLLISVILVSCLLISHRKPLFVTLLFALVAVASAYTLFSYKEVMTNIRLNYGTLIPDGVKLSGNIIADPIIGGDNSKYEIAVKFFETGQNELKPFATKVSKNVFFPVESKEIVFLVEVKRYPGYMIGDVCEFTYDNSRVRNISSDYHRYLNQKGISYPLRSFDLTCDPPEDIRELSNYLKFRRIAYSIKVLLARNIESRIVEPYASLWLGILFGDDRRFSDEMVELFQVTQTTHIIAASGFNISVVEAIVDRFSKKVLKMKVRLIVIMILSFVYCAWANMSGSILRAYIMSCFRYLAKFSGNRYDPFDSLLYTTVILSLFDVNPLINIGYLLSGAATFGVIAIYPGLRRILQRVSNQLANSKPIQSVMVSLCCSTATYPVIYLFWGKASLLGVISNLFLLDIVELVYFNGLFVLLFTQINRQISTLFLYLQFALIKSFVDLVRFFGNLFQFAVFQVYIEKILLLFSVVIILFVLQSYLSDLSSKYVRSTDKNVEKYLYYN